ncbi:hypothetical protein Salat_2154900 [Sesamum alatum]|uniref:Uncharacterized protein n=1 Tax=Sesamum alatum TaxID=300844 RepID=A0AAE1Y2I1_9LAMI|nr:hypothetical protein Salat_2154900 [Sesamum alatum]
MGRVTGDAPEIFSGDRPLVPLRQRRRTAVGGQWQCRADMWWLVGWAMGAPSDCPDPVTAPARAAERGDLVSPFLWGCRRRRPACAATVPLLTYAPPSAFTKSTSIRSFCASKLPSSSPCIPLHFNSIKFL